MTATAALLIDWLPSWSAGESEAQLKLKQMPCQCIQMFRAIRFGYPYPAARGCFVSKLETPYQRQSVFRGKRRDTIDACRFLALVVLSDAAHCQTFG